MLGNISRYHLHRVHRGPLLNVCCAVCLSFVELFGLAQSAVSLGAPGGSEKYNNKQKIKTQHQILGTSWGPVGPGVPERSREVGK